MKLHKGLGAAALAFLLFLLVSCGKGVVYEETAPSDTSIQGGQGEAEASASPDTSVAPTQNKTDFSSDALLVVNEIEGAHPIFITEELPDNYSDIREKYLEYTSAPLTKTEFLLATQEYLTILSDGHMGSGLLRRGMYIDVDWISENSRIYLSDANGTLSGAEVIAIGGIPLKDVMKQVETYYFAENESARQQQYAAYCRQEEMLSLAGCQYGSNLITITLDNGGITSMMECKLEIYNRESIYYGSSPNYIVKLRMIGDVFYIDLRVFQDDKSIDATVDAIKTAIEDGITKFIIDVRDNGGGNSIVGEKLLNAMGMTPPSYGAYVRFSDLSEVYGVSNSESFVYYEPTVETAKSNTNISLSILTNRLTFSSATMLGVWVQDGRLGNIVGQPSSNSPTSYGDMLSVHLPQSGIDLRISYKKFLRPDANADPTTLHPDILLESGEDALDIALEYLAQR